jgi:hypothetical protein
MTTYSPFEGMRDLVPVEAMPPVRTDRDIYHVWRLLMGPLGFGCRRLWVTLTETDGRVSPVLQQIEDVPRRISPAECGGVMTMLDGLRPLFTGGAVALLYSRPGRRPMDDDDRSWARSLSRAARSAEVPLWPVHFANDEELLVFAPDDLTGAAGAH